MKTMKKWSISILQEQHPKTSIAFRVIWFINHAATISPKGLDRYVRIFLSFVRNSSFDCAAEYMTLPVSQYSVLDADKVERLDEDTFRVQTSRVKFFGVEMTPIMTLTVKPHSTGCEITMLDCTVNEVRSICLEFWFSWKEAKLFLTPINDLLVQ